MVKENILDKLMWLEKDYVYYRHIGDYESALDCLDWMEYYLDELLGDKLIDNIVGV